MHDLLSCRWCFHDPAERLRQHGISTLVLVLSALSDVEERVRGLRSGGDDYLTKPFALAELCARVDTLLRRSPGPRTTLLRVGELETFRQLEQYPAPKHGIMGATLRGRRSVDAVQVGAWRSLVAHLHGVQGVGGSNPLAPTK